MRSDVKIIERSIVHFHLVVEVWCAGRWLGCTFIGQHGSLHYLPLDYYDVMK